jgi:ATP-dependent helicase HrpB
MIVLGQADGVAELAAAVAAVVAERGLGGDDPDLQTRLDRLRRDESERGRNARALAKRWADLAARRGRRAAGEGAPTPGRLLALAYPERVAKARGGVGEYRLASGRGAQLDPGHPLAREPWLAVGELGGGAVRDRILLAAPLDAERIPVDFADQLTTEEILDTDAQGRLRARRITRLGRLEVATKDVPVDPGLVRRALLDRVRSEGLAALPPSEALDRFRARTAFMRKNDPDAWPDLSNEGLITKVETWLEPLLDGLTSLAQIPPSAIAEAVADLLPWDLRRELDRAAPTHFEAPTGSRLPIDYAAEGGPEATVRVQELFGLTRHPMVSGRPLRLVLLSPAHRPLQTTADLPGFWRGSWTAVRTEMRGRYPRHPWPEDPAAAPPTTRAKPRGQS